MYSTLTYSLPDMTTMQKSVIRHTFCHVLSDVCSYPYKDLGASCEFRKPPKLSGASDLRTVRGGADPPRMPPTGPQRASPKLFTISDGQSCFFGGIPFLDFAFAVTTIGWSRASRWTPECRCTNSNPAVPMGIVLTTVIAALMSNSCNLVIYPKVTPPKFTT